MLTLYHNALSTCSQKVRLVLAEKGIEFESKLIDLVSGQQHDAQYVALNPKHVVPTLVVDGEVLRESSEQAIQRPLGSRTGFEPQHIP